MPILDVMIPPEASEVEECVVVTWLKREKDIVEKDEVLLPVQAEKVSFEVPAPANGQLMAILVQQGEVVERGQPLARLEVAALEEATRPCVTPPRQSRLRQFRPAHPRNPRLADCQAAGPRA